MDQAERRISLHPIGQRARWRTERACGVGFAEAVLDGVWPRIVTADLDDDLAVAADHGCRHAVAISFASFDRGLHDGHCDGSGQVLVTHQFRARWSGQSAGRGESDGGTTKPGWLHGVTP